MFKNLFRPDSPLMMVMTQITDCLFLSMFWILGCIPVVTAGASFAALYDAIWQGFRQGEKNTWQCFLRTYRRNWKESLLPTLTFFAVIILLGKPMIRLWNSTVGGEVSWMLFAVGAVAGLLVVGALSILFPMLSRFENSFPVLLRNTALMALAQLPRTLALGIPNAATVYLCVRFVIPLCFLPGLTALLSTWLIEPMFKPFMPKETDSEDAA